MNKQVAAALTVLGLTEVPKTEVELRKVYRSCVKKSHPDRTGKDGTDFIRIHKSRQVLLDAILDGDKPCVLVRFGDGDALRAESILNSRYNKGSDIKYIVTLKWLLGLCVSVNSGEWKEVLTMDDIIEGNTVIRFI